MIDLHAHILYGLDDGAEDREMMLNMFKIAAEDGIRKIVATPHHICGANQYDAQTLDKRYDEAVEMIKSNGIDIELYKGSEVFLDEYVPDSIKNGTAPTLAGTRYVLVELPMLGFPKQTESILYRILCDGYIPVIAHVERYADIQKDIGILKGFIEMGCLSQVNATSINGTAGRKVQETVKTIVTCSMAHLVSSDCHSDRRRSPRLKAAFETVRTWLGDEKAEKIFDRNPQSVLKNEAVDVDEPVIIQKKRFFNFKIPHKLPWGV